MRAEIASLHERMREGGNWRAWRDEISALHAEATTQEEYVTLLEAHRNLVAVGEYAYDRETYAEIVPIARAEYLVFLNKEAMEDDRINPVLLDRITQREVEAGRLDPEDDFRKLAAAGALLGDSAEYTAHRCKQGDYFFLGMAAAAVLAFALQRFTQISPLWLVAAGLLIGWFINERERLRIKREIAAPRGWVA